MVLSKPADFRLHFFRCGSGENINEALELLLQQTGAGAIYMPSVQAQFTDVTLGCFDPAGGRYELVALARPGAKNHSDWERYSKFEPTALHGNVTWIGEKPFAHVHGAFASGFPEDAGRIIGGGHVVSATVGRTCEGVVFICDSPKICRLLDTSPECQVKIWNFA